MSAQVGGGSGGWRSHRDDLCTTGGAHGDRRLTWLEQQRFRNLNIPAIALWLHPLGRLY